MRQLAILFAVLALVGRADAFSDGDRAAVQSVIEQQLQAFNQDDAATAYSFASPRIRELFPTQDIFMNLVRQGYRPVYRQRSHAFGGLEDGAGGLSQTVDIVDAEGIEWTALYTLEKQPDGSWQITGCFLVKKPGIGV